MLFASNIAHEAKSVQSGIKLNGVPGGLKSFAVAVRHSRELLWCGWKKYR